MPNWCNNKLILNADKKSLDSLLCEIHKHNCLFDFLCPLPNDIVNDQEWTRENWGTKWNVHLADLDINRASDNDVSIGFDTAWTPPVAFIKTLINAYLQSMLNFITLRMEWALQAFIFIRIKSFMIYPLSLTHWNISGFL